MELRTFRVGPTSVMSLWKCPHKTYPELISRALQVLSSQQGEPARLRYHREVVCGLRESNTKLWVWSDLDFCTKSQSAVPLSQEPPASAPARVLPPAAPLSMMRMETVRKLLSLALFSLFSLGLNLFIFYGVEMPATDTFSRVPEEIRTCEQCRRGTNPGLGVQPLGPQDDANILSLAYVTWNTKQTGDMRVHTCACMFVCVHVCIGMLCACTCA